VAKFSTSNINKDSEKKSQLLPSSSKRDAREDSNSSATNSSRASHSSLLPKLGKLLNWRDFFNKKELELAIQETNEE